MTDEIRFIGDLQRVEVRPDDLFVLKPAKLLTWEDRRSIVAYWQTINGYENVPKLMILAPGDEIGVMGAPSVDTAVTSLAQSFLDRADEDFTWVDPEDVKTLARAVLGK